jgi:hypothetical protein
MFSDRLLALPPDRDYPEQAERHAVLYGVIS